MNFGLRYDYMQPMQDSKKDLSVFRPGLTPTGIAFQGKDISSIYEPDWNSFSPRVGFSYQPDSSQAMVIRGGAGIFFDTPNANPFLDNRPGNSAPNGLEGNPGGRNPVFTITTAATRKPGHHCARQGDYSHADAGLHAWPTPAASSASTRISARLITSTSTCRSRRQLGPKAFFQIGYVGSEGRKLLSLLNINQPHLGGAPGLR